MRIRELLTEFHGDDLFYHGGNAASITATGFDPYATGKGNDELGSGFYFTNDKSEASGYAEGEGAGVVAVRLDLKKPIIVPSHGNLNDVDIPFNTKKVFSIIKQSPIIRDMEETPLWDFVDISKAKKITDQHIMHVADMISDGCSLYSLENDFFRSHATAFREAVHSVLKYDGVVKRFDGGREHRVAWFPHQIKLVNS